MVRMPMQEPVLPDRGESFIRQLVVGTILQSQAEYANFLAGFWFRRVYPIVVAPFDMVAGQTTQTAETNWIPLLTDSLTNYLMLAFGVSNVKAGAYIEAEVREAPTVVATLATPGSGDLVDPGCRWRQENGDLISPVVHRRYEVWGLQWARTGLYLPPTVDPEVDTMEDQPRVLHCVPGADHELVINWDDCSLNSVMVYEMYQPTA